MQHPTDVSEQAAWVEMQKLLQQKKKRRFIIWWFVFGSLLLLGVVTLFLMHGREKNVANTIEMPKQTSNNETVKTQANNNNVNSSNTAIHQENSLVHHDINTTKSNEPTTKNKKTTETNSSTETEKHQATNNHLILKNDTEGSPALNKKGCTKTIAFKANHNSDSNKILASIFTDKQKKLVDKKLRKGKPQIAFPQASKKIKGIVEANENSKSYADINAFKLQVPTQKSASNTADSISNFTNNSATVSAVDSTKKTIEQPNQNGAQQAVAAKNNITKKANKSPVKFGAGLDWNLQLPLTKSDYFYTSKNLSPNVFNYFIPSVWANASLGSKHTLLLGFTPFAQYNSKSVTYNSISGNWVNIDPKIESQIVNDNSWYITIIDSVFGPRTVIDTSIIVTKVSNISKAFGYAFYADYYYNLNKHWQVGVGVMYNSITSYINSSSVYRKANSQLIYADTSLQTPAQSNGAINNYFISGKLSVLYSFKKYSLGLNATLPFNGINKEGEISKAPSFNILFRLKIK